MGKWQWHSSYVQSSRMWATRLWGPKTAAVLPFGQNGTYLAAAILAADAIPTALAKPCPRGPVVASTPYVRGAATRGCEGIGREALLCVC